MAAKPTALEKLRTLLRAKQVTTLAQMARLCTVHSEQCRDDCTS